MRSCKFPHSSKTMKGSSSNYYKASATRVEQLKQICFNIGYFSPHYTESACVQAAENMASIWFQDKKMERENPPNINIYMYMTSLSLSIYIHYIVYIYIYCPPCNQHSTWQEAFPKGNSSSNPRCFRCYVSFRDCIHIAYSPGGSEKKGLSSPKFWWLLTIHDDLDYNTCYSARLKIKGWS